MGIFGGLSLLTKNSTYFVFLVPGIVILGTGSIGLLRKPALWLGGALAVAIYLPWLYIARSVLLLGIHGLEMPGFWGITRHYGAVLWEQMSFLLPLAMAGASIILFRLMRSGKREIDGVSASMIALLPACLIGIFLAKVPVQSRLMILPFAAIVFLGIESIFAFFRRPNRVAAGVTAALAVTAGMHWMQFRYPPVNDMRDGVAFLLARDAGRPGSVLLPSSREGPWIAEFAQADPLRPQRILVRPTKMLGQEDWNGSDWKPYYRTVQELGAFFEKTPVKYCILNREPRRSYPHDELLRTMLISEPDRWRPVNPPHNGSEPGYFIYENTHWTPAAEPLVYQETNRVVNQVLKTSQ
jgi:hypothetical protein